MIGSLPLTASKIRRGDARKATLYLALRPLNPEGVAVVDTIQARMISRTRPNFG